MKPSEVLRAARKLVEDPALWARGTGYDGCALCVSMAISEAAKVSGVCSADFIFARAIGVKDETAGVYAWNDAPERTHAEVLEAFDRAIALAESEGK